MRSRRAPRVLASPPPLAHSRLHVRRIPRADLLHTLSATALGPAGRNVMLQPHQASRRATTTSVSLRIFEPLVPQHPMATLLQRSARSPGLHMRTRAGTLALLLRSRSLRTHAQVLLA